MFTTSGESAALEDPIIINPTDIRNMAGWIIDQCVNDPTRGDAKGGAITKYIKRAADWVLNSSEQDFRTEKFREFAICGARIRILFTYSSARHDILFSLCIEHHV